TARKLLRFRQNHALTREFLRMGSLKGQLYDGQARLLYDFYSVFNIVKKQINFALTTPATDVRAKCDELLDHLEVNLRGESMNGVRVLASRRFFDRLVAHPNVEKFYLNWQAANALSGQVRAFDFGGIVWEPYIAVSTGADGQSKSFI